jgi:hypothetical protein
MEIINDAVEITPNLLDVCPQAGCAQVCPAIGCNACIRCSTTS